MSEINYCFWKIYKLVQGFVLLGVIFFSSRVNYFSLLMALIEFIATSEMPADRLLRESFHSSRQSTWMLMRQSRSERDSCKRRRTTLKEEWVPLKGWQRPWGEAVRTSAATSGVSETRKEVLYFTNKTFKFARGTFSLRDYFVSARKDFLTAMRIPSQFDRKNYFL